MNWIRPCRTVSVGLMLAAMAMGPTADAAAPVVAGFERFGKTDAAAGQLLLAELNCIACHQPPETAELLKQAPVLDKVGERLRPGYFRAFLGDPQKVKPGSTMPNVFAGDADAASKIDALVHFLASTGSPKEADGNAKAAAVGRDLYHKIGCVACHGTRNAQGQSELSTAATVPLGDLAAKYTVPSLATFLLAPHVARPSGRMPSLLIKGDAKARAKEADELASYLIPKTPATEKFALTEELVKKGRELFASEGCANCHPIKDIKSTAAKAPTLASLKATGGCLANAPVRGTPWFELNPAQRTALAAALKAPLERSKAPADVVARTLLTFNCYACHSRDKLGGPEAELDKSFQTLQPEMGDEARVPPFLDHVGAKIRPTYLKQILNDGSLDRPYMVTRMPAFGAANVEPFLAAVVAADKDKFAAAPEIAFTDSNGKVKGIGRHLVGAKVFSCYKCHTFAGQKAEGTQGIDMTLFPVRLQPSWFHAYLYDPQKIRPGTRMPSAFDKGKSPMANILGGSGAAQTEAIWRYLADGKGAQLPEGFAKSAIPLTPTKDAILYRNFIKGAGARAIGVGYPEAVNLAFDANEMRLALIWHGSFIDASLHWSGRGQGYQSPLGDNVLSLPTGPSFAFLSSADEAWPKAAAKILGAKFGGYRLAPDERPTFLYSIRDVKIEDFPTGVVVNKESGLRRVIDLTAGKEAGDLYFRAAVGNKIEAVGDGVYRIDGGLRMKLTSSAMPVLRTSGGKSELIVPVTFTNGQARIIQELNW